MQTAALPALLASCLFATAARADVHATAPAGGGLPVLTVRVDLGAGMVTGGAQPLPIGLAHDRLPVEGDVTVEAIPIGEGRQIVHVRVPAKDDETMAWESLLAAGQQV